MVQRLILASSIQWGVVVTFQLKDCETEMTFLIFYGESGSWIPDCFLSYKFYDSTELCFLMSAILVSRPWRVACVSLSGY